MQDDLDLLGLCLMALNFMGYHETTPVIAHRHAYSYC